MNQPSNIEEPAEGAMNENAPRSAQTAPEPQAQGSAAPALSGPAPQNGQTPVYGSAAQNGVVIPLPYPPKPPRVLPAFDMLDSMYCVLSFVVGFFVIRYMLWYNPGFLSTLTALGALACTVYYLFKKKVRIGAFGWLCIGLAAVLSLAASWTSDRFVKVLTSLAIFSLVTFLVFLCGSGRKFTEFLPRDTAAAAFHPFEGLDYIYLPKPKKGKLQLSRNTLYVFLGLLISIPLITVVWSLLNSADQAMNQFSVDFWDYLEDLDIDMLDIIVQLIFAVPIAMYFFSMLSLHTGGVKKGVLTDDYYKAAAAKGRVIPQALIYATVSPVLVIYIIYVCTQMRYFLSGFAGELPNGFSYSEYAVRGFYELFFLAVLNLGVILFMRRFTKGSDNPKNLTLRIYSSVMSLLTLFLVASASSKLILYVRQYGLTRDRVIASFVLCGVALTFLFILLQQFVSAFPAVRASAAGLTLLFLILAFGRIDYQIARFNIQMYKEGYHKELDVRYLVYTLGDESLLYIVENDEESTINRAIAAGDAHSLTYDSYSGESFTDCRDMILARVNRETEDDHRFQNLSARRLRSLVREKYVTQAV